MKYTTLFFCTFFMSSLTFAQKIPFQQLDFIKGKYFQRNTIAPFSGKAIDKHYNGKKKLEIAIKDGQLDGTSREWAFNGKKIFEANYKKNVPVGIEMRWYDNGNKKQEVHFENGMPEGMATEWFANAQKMSQGKMKNGLEEGIFTWWFKDGNKEQEVNYSNGKPNGTIKKWHPNGQQQLESNYVNGVIDGIAKEWYLDGTLNSEAHFSNDQEDGKATIWSKKGIVLEEKIFEKGILKEDKNYRSGNIKTQSGYTQVFNHKADFFTVDISATKVGFREATEITFAVDGKLLQMFDYPLDKYLTSIDATKSTADLLNECVQLEASLIKEATNFDIDVVKETGKTKKGLEYVKWNFVSPSSKDADQKPRTVVEEHYYSFIIGNRILNLYSVVTNSDNTNEIINLLKKVSNTVTVHENRIDLNKLAKEANRR